MRALDGWPRRSPAAGVTAGDTVATLLSNTPEMYEAHFGVPMTGAVLNTLNTRLDARAIAFMLEHGGGQGAPGRPRILRARGRGVRHDRPAPARDRRRRSGLRRRRRVVGRGVRGVSEPRRPGICVAAAVRRMERHRAQLHVGHDRRPERRRLRITAAPTSTPSANVLAWNMPRYPVYLWTLPMFHCNGWCFPWTIAAQSGTNVCLRKVEPATIFRLMREHRVTHYCGAPVVHNTLLAAPPELRDGLTHRIHAMVAGASPPSSMIEGLGANQHSSSRTPTVSPRCMDRAPCARSRKSGRALEPNELCAAQRTAGRAVRAPGRRRRARPGSAWSVSRPTARPWARSCSAGTS